MRSRNIIVIVFLLLLVSCSKSQTADNNQAGSKSPPSEAAVTNKADIPPSLDMQASAQAYKLLTEHWSVCGDLLAARLTNDFGGQALNNFKGHDYVEMKGVAVEIRHLELTEADKLNGVEWSGYAEYHAEAGRYHFPAETTNTAGNGDQSAPRWDKWQVASFMNMLPTFYIHKDNGKWSGSPYQRGDLLRFIQTTPCDQVPK